MAQQHSTLVVKNIGQLLTMRPEAGPRSGPSGEGRDASLVGLVEDAVVVIRDGLIEAAGPRSVLGPAAAAPAGAAGSGVGGEASASGAVGCSERHPLALNTAPIADNTSKRFMNSRRFHISDIVLVLSLRACLRIYR